MEPGMIVFYGKAEIPEGYLLCNGQSVLRATYPFLFAVIGTTYGSADATHFNVPDLGTRTATGVDPLDGYYDVIGKAGGAKSIDIAHVHSMNPHTHPFVSGTVGPAQGNKLQNDGPSSAATTTNHIHSVTAMASSTQSDVSTSTGGSSTQSILMASTTVYPLIKST
jgi:microcystin-dependent protein